MSQAPNDNFAQTKEILVPDNGYAVGSFQSDLYTLDAATVEPGEFVPQMLKQTGNDKKTIWFKFSLANSRTVGIELLQKDSGINQNHVGLAVYQSYSGTLPPTQHHLSSAFPVLTKFGLSGATCVGPGTFYVQVTANIKARDSIFLKVNVALGDTKYDIAAEAPVFQAWDYAINKGIDFKTPCLGVDDISEIEYHNGDIYNRSAWVVINVPQTFHSQYLEILTDWDRALPPGVKAKAKIYRGNIKNDLLVNLIPINESSGPVSAKKCDSFPAGEYTLRFLAAGEISFGCRVNLSFVGRDTGDVDATNPTKIPPSHVIQLKEGPGTGIHFEGGFSCNSYLPDHPCGEVNKSPIYANNDTFDMAAWFILENFDPGLLEIGHNSLRVPSGYDNFRPENLLYRVFRGDVRVNCNLKEAPLYTCGHYLEKGIYSLQVLGKSVNKRRYAWDNLYPLSGFGSRYSGSLRFNKKFPNPVPQALFANPNFPEDVGEVANPLKPETLGKLTGLDTVFRTYVIAGDTLSGHFSFHQVQVSNPTRLYLQSGHNYYIYKGKISEGIHLLSKNFENNFAQRELDIPDFYCKPVMPGNYTLVRNWKYLFCDQFQVKLTQIPPECEEKYIYPSQAEELYNLSPLDFGTHEIKSCIPCVPDLPFLNKFKVLCPELNLTVERTQIVIFNNKNNAQFSVRLNKKYLLYQGNLKNDSLGFFDKSKLILPCSGKQDFICNLPAGIYTLVIFEGGGGPAGNHFYLESIAGTPHDFAHDALDMGDLKVGNLHISASQPFSCDYTRNLSDPDSLYVKNQNSKLPHYKGNMYAHDSRVYGNMWFTFTCEGSGELLFNSTNSSFTFILVESPADGSIPFNVLRNGSFDTSLSQGLMYKANINISSSSSYSFQKTNCARKRYFIIVLGNAQLKTIGLKITFTPKPSEPGDFCTDAMDYSISSPGTSKFVVKPPCHTAGEGIGEDGGPYSCLDLGRVAYKTSWVKVSINPGSKFNVSCKLEHPQRQPVAFRIFYGNCQAMTPGPCSKGSGSFFRLDCMSPGDYYFQIATPIDDLESVNLEITVDSSSDPFCKPFDLLAPVANYNFEGGCASGEVKFNNLSTIGDDIKYFWDFGNGIKSNVADTTVAYVPHNMYDTFQVRLVAFNINLWTSDTLTLPVIVRKVPLTLSISGDSIITCGDDVLLTAQSNALFPKYEWYTVPGTQTSNTGTFLLKAVTTFSYVHLRMLEGPCYLNDSSRLWVDTKLYLLNDTIICGKKPITYALNLPGNISWNDGSNSPNYSISKAGNYNLTHEYKGCFFRDYFKVEALKAAIDFGDTVICDAESVDLSASRGLGSRLWSNGDTGLFTTYLLPGNHWAEASYSYCTVRDSFKLEFVDLSGEFLLDDTTKCPEDELKLQANGLVAEKYNWSHGQSGLEASFTDSGSYYVIISKAHCKYRKDFRIHHFPYTLELGNDTQFCKGVELVLDAGEGISHSWNPAAVNDRYFSVLEAGLVWVMKENVYGCIETDSIAIEENCGPYMHVPTAFSPNGDGLNDNFYVVWGFITEFKLQIFNRWGEEVVVLRNPGEIWDGTFQGKPCPMGAYIWYLTYKGSDYSGKVTKKTLKGTVSLLR